MGIRVSRVSTCDPLEVEASFLGWQSIRPSHVGSAITYLGFVFTFTSTQSQEITSF